MRYYKHPLKDQKLNITLTARAKRRLSDLAVMEKRSVSGLVEVMTDERWSYVEENRRYIAKRIKAAATLERKAKRLRRP